MEEPLPLSLFLSVLPYTRGAGADAVAGGSVPATL